MKKNNIIRLFFLLAVVSWTLTGCYKDIILLDDGSNTPAPTNVSFAKDVQSIFNAKCNTTGCHSAGGQKPNLSASSAYNALISGGYINTTTPEQSELYLWMKGAKTIPMPPSGINATDNATVLAWIREGAKNN